MVVLHYRYLIMYVVHATRRGSIRGRHMRAWSARGIACMCSKDRDHDLDLDLDHDHDHGHD